MIDYKDDESIYLYMTHLLMKKHTRDNNHPEFSLFLSSSQRVYINYNTQSAFLNNISMETDSILQSKKDYFSILEKSRERLKDYIGL